MKSVLKLLSWASVVVLLINCNPAEQSLEPANLDHALQLVDSMLIDGQQIKWISIYADAPSYEPVHAAGEGVSCVDDVGRFLEVLEFEINRNHQEELLPLAEGMTKFLLYLSREDGLWYNFILEDGSINKEYRTSIASFQWWAVRGLRGLGASYRIFSGRADSKLLTEQIHRRFLASQPQLDSLFSNYPQMTIAADGSERPGWNLSNAPDQSAELLLALSGVHGLGEFNYEKEIGYLAEALLGWQYHGDDMSYKGMYFCWQNSWHAWGSNQTLALLQAYIILGKEDYLNSVKLWADHFLPTLIAANFPAEIQLDSTGSWQIQQYSQIAYGQSSTYRGIHLLAALTGSSDYAQKAETTFAWFKGKNIATTQMYDPNTGRCFDGIYAADGINMNSGAESTIECLLAIQARGGW